MLRREAHHRLTGAVEPLRGRGPAIVRELGEPTFEHALEEHVADGGFELLDIAGERQLGAGFGHGAILVGWPRPQKGSSGRVSPAGSSTPRPSPRRPASPS